MFGNVRGMFGNVLKCSAMVGLWFKLSSGFGRFLPNFLKTWWARCRGCCSPGGLAFGNLRKPRKALNKQPRSKRNPRPNRIQSTKRPIRYRPLPLEGVLGQGAAGEVCQRCGRMGDRGDNVRGCAGPQTLEPDRLFGRRHPTPDPGEGTRERRRW